MKLSEIVGIAIVMGGVSGAAVAADSFGALGDAGATPMKAAEMQSVRGMKGVAVVQLDHQGTIRLVSNALANGKKDSVDKVIVVVKGGKNLQYNY